MNAVLVLNYDFTPLNVTSVRRGFVLVDKGKAEIVRAADTPIASSYKKFVRPTIIRLLKYIKHYSKVLRANRNRIYKRDGYQCVYCGSHRNLTLDHVIPKSRGGKNEWTNLVTSCQKCNMKKADKTPQEAKMNLRHEPFALTIVNENNSLSRIWEDFKNNFVY